MSDDETPTVLGVLSDTHGFLDPRVFDIFDGVDHILHAGDLGSESVAVELEAISPVTAVAGNVDAHLPPGRFPALRLFQAGRTMILVVHEAIVRGKPLPAVGDHVRDHRADLVIFGHTHKPYAGWPAPGGGGSGGGGGGGDCFFFNPGSAGKKRFTLPRTVGRLVVAPGGGIAGRLISLEGRTEDEREFAAPGREAAGPGVETLS